MFDIYIKYLMMIRRDIASLKAMGILTRKGADNCGEWIIQP